MRVLVWWTTPTDLPPVVRNATSTGVLTFEHTKFQVLLAQTPEETTRGLSGTPSLPRGEGMLFFFDTLEKRGFWMPDMHFSIDIVWIDADWKVVDVTLHATPESYPKTTFYPKSPAKYVLEVNAGIADEWGIHEGTQFSYGGRE